MPLNEWICGLLKTAWARPIRRRRFRSTEATQGASAEVLEHRQLLTAQISIAAISAVTEGQDARFSVTLSEAASSSVSVNYSTVESAGPTTATSGVDFTTSVNQSLTFSPGETTKSIVIATINDSLPEGTETFDVVLSNPSGATLNVSSASATINDDDGALRTVSIADASNVSEGQNASFTVTLSAAASSAVSVKYSTSSGSGPEGATNGSDITAVANATLTFSAGETEKTILIATIDDQLPESNEVFTVSLSSPNGLTLEDREATATIIDNDSGGGLPAISIIDAAAIIEGVDSAFTVRLSTASTTAVTVQYSTVVDTRPTAASAADFTVRSNQTLTFNPGQTQKTISVPTTDDAEVEDTETFSIVLSNPVGATLSSASAIGTINDNEVALPGFSVTNALAVTEGNAVAFTVSLSRVASTTLTVDYSTATGSGPSPATNNVDFNGVTNQTLTFSPGQTQKTITIVTTDDDLLEPAEVFQLNLSNPAGGSRIITAQGIGTINDNDGAPGFSVTRTSVSVNESGTTDTFGVVLSTAPASNVVFNISSSDTGEATVTPATLTFTASNWQTVQTVTVAGVNDAIVDGNQSTSITVSVNDAASANAFDNLPNQIVNATTVDDDTAAGFSILSPLGTIADQFPSFSWTPIAGAASYDMELVQVGGSNERLIQRTVNGTSLDATTALAIGRYRTWVRATLGNGTKTPWQSDVFQMNTSTTIDEIAFHGTDRTPTFSWTPVSGATSYRVFLSNRTTGGAAVFNDVVNGTSFTPAADLNFGRYLIWVRPTGLGGYEAAWSTSEDYYVGPTLLGPVGGTLDSTPQFTWTSISGAATYHLFVTGPGGVLINEPGLTGTSFTPTTALPTGDFRWWIKPSTATGAGGAWSPAIRFSTGGRTTVTSHSGTVTDSIPVLSWGAVPGAQSYEVYVSKVGSPGALYRQAGITGTSYPSLALVNGDYTVWIRTTLAGGTSAWGGGIAFTVGAQEVALQTTPLSPASPGFDTTPQFLWSATTGAVSYDVYLHSGSQAILQSNLTGTSWTPTTALASGDWTWTIRPRNSAGATGLWSSANHFSTSGRTDLLTPNGTTADRTPTFSWQAVSGAIRYIIQVDSLTTGAGRIIREENVTGTSLTPTTPLVPGTYRAWVRAVSNSSIAPWSLQVDFIVS